MVNVGIILISIIFVIVFTYLINVINNKDTKIDELYDIIKNVTEKNIDIDLEAQRIRDDIDMLLTATTLKSTDKEYDYDDVRKLLIIFETVNATYENNED